MDTETGTERLLRFGLFELDTRSRELKRGRATIRLQEQPFEILRLLLGRPGEVVTRDEMRQQLWPDGTFVDFEHSLNAAIKRLRAALGDEADNPRFVETVPRRGHRLVVPGSGRATAGQTNRAETPTHVARLAVLPFTDLGGDDQEYFSAGLTEEMISQLGRLCGDQVGVIARWSSMAFRGSRSSIREIGQALRADYLLEGSVRRAGDRARITARLIEAAGETHLWAETYDRHLTDGFSVQADVAARIAQSLATELLPDRTAVSNLASGDAAAYQAYLKGRFYWNKPGDQGLDQAIGFLDQALSIDPGFAAAHAARARASVARAEYYHEVPRRALEAAETGARRALELDPSLAEAHLAWGDVRRLLAWDWRGAEEAYTRAITLNPSLEGAHRAYGMLLAASSRMPEARREVDRAVELDPCCLVVGTGAAWVSYLEGDYDGAINRCRDTIDMDSRYGCFVSRPLVAAAHLQAGRGREAIAELETAMACVGPEPILVAWQAHTLAVTGARRKAVGLVQQLVALEDRSDRHVAGYHLAIAHVGLGNVDAAFTALDRAAVEHDPELSNVAVEPRFDTLRADPRYARLLRRLHLPRQAGLEHEAYSA